MKGITILSTGAAWPKKVVTNDDLSRIMDTSDEWIYTRTGIRSRHVCVEETCGSLAIEAAREAVLRAGISKEEIGLILAATITPDHLFPSTACMVQKALELPEELMAFDLSAACTGFLYALGTARALLGNMEKKYALVIGCEQMSKILDYSDRSTSILFGDGAGAAVVGLSEQPFFQKCYTRGNKEVLYCEGPGKAEARLHMSGNEVFRFAVTAMEKAMEECLLEAGLTMEDIDAVICHQANGRIIRHVQKKYKDHEDKFFVNIESFGNTSAASAAIALHETMEQGIVKKGSRILMVAFGAGLGYSSAIFTI